MLLKKPLSFSDQLERLKSHGVIIKDEKSAENFIHSVNYYRLTGYMLQFRKGSSSSDLASPHSFEEIQRLYIFDCNLRHILRKYLEIIEVHYKTQVSNYFALEKCLTPPYDQHYDESNYYNKSGFKHVLSTFSSNQRYYTDSLIVKHHKERYGGKMPLWVMVEMMSFSSFSKLYSAMYRSSQENIARHLHVNAKTLVNHLHCLSMLRNKCAHAARLLNVRYNPPAKMSSSFLRNNPSISNSSLFAYILVLKWRLPNTDLQSQLKTDINNLTTEFKDVLDLSLIGFPANYMNIL